MTPFKARITARYLHAGGIIAYPTETVYGLGCHPLHADAVMKLLKMKQRSWKKGLILIASDFELLLPYIRLPEQQQLQQALDSWPGANTWVFPAAADCPRWLTGTHPGIAVRVTSHPDARLISDTAKTALVSTSANISHRQPARSATACRSMFPDLDPVISGHVDRNAQPSRIQDIITQQLYRAQEPDT